MKNNQSIRKCTQSENEKSTMKPQKNKVEKLYSQIEELLSVARKTIVNQVNQTMVYTYYEVGRIIVEYEQEGKERAEYGKGLLKSISKRLSQDFGKGFSTDNLEKMRKFYLTYSKSETVSRKSGKPNFRLSWSHYLILMRIKKEEERRFYEIESKNSNWSVRELKRQFDSSLFERLVLSRDKKGVKELSEKGQILNVPKDAIKEPYILEFLLLLG